AETAGAIARFLQKGRKTISPDLRRQWGLKITDLVISPNPAGKEACSRDAANRGGDKRIAEANALGREPVDMRRLQRRMAGTRQTIPALVVGQKQDEIGSNVPASGGGKQHDNDEQAVQAHGGKLGEILASPTIPTAPRQSQRNLTCRSNC